MLIAMTIAGLVNLAMLSIFAVAVLRHRRRTRSRTPTTACYVDPGRWAAYLLGDRAARVGALVVVRRHDGRPGRDAGLHPPPDPDLRRAARSPRRRRSSSRSIGVDPTRALVLSQVVLSFGIPFALVPLVLFTSSRT